jgi:hypothetical protein
MEGCQSFTIWQPLGASCLASLPHPRQSPWSLPSRRRGSTGTPTSLFFTGITLVTAGAGRQTAGGAAG